jgi:DNA-binding MarR family transcriptional regulator
MVGAGMLERSPGAADKRTVEYTLTTPGAQLVDLWRTTNESLLLSAILALGAQDRQELAGALPVLERLVAAIDEQAQTPSRADAASIE